MSAKYRVMKMKDVAQNLRLIPAKKFANTDEYLEYAIREINGRSKFFFHQFLYLLETLYLVAVEKSSVDVNYYSSPAEKVLQSPAETVSEPMGSVEISEKVEKDLNKIKDPNYVKNNIQQVKLNW